MTGRKHYVVLAQRDVKGKDEAEWIVGWSLDEARSHARLLRKKGYAVQIREVGPVVQELKVSA